MESHRKRQVIMLPSYFHDCFPEVTELPASWHVIEHKASFLIYEPMGSIAFIHFAGTHPNHRNLGSATEGFPVVIKQLKDEGFSQAQMAVKVDNIAPQLLALKNGFLVMAALNGPNNDFQLIFRKDF
jgi:hypothetical protein